MKILYITIQNSGLGENMSGAEKVLVGVECCGTIVKKLISPPGPETIICIVCGELHLAWT